MNDNDTQKTLITKLIHASSVVGDLQILNKENSIIKYMCFDYLLNGNYLTDDAPILYILQKLLKNNCVVKECLFLFHDYYFNKYKTPLQIIIEEKLNNTEYICALLEEAEYLEFCSAFDKEDLVIIKNHYNILKRIDKLKEL